MEVACEWEEGSQCQQDNNFLTLQGLLPRLSLAFLINNHTGVTLAHCTRAVIFHKHGPKQCQGLTIQQTLEEKGV